MTRPFGDADRAKKMKRIASDGNAAPAEAMSRLREAVRDSVRDGYLQCASAFGIAKRLDLPLAAVGVAADDLGVRVVDCQLGCFKVDKAVHQPGGQETTPLAEQGLARLVAAGPLTCQGVFAMARELKLRPGQIADAANVQHIKIHHCQLGCF